ncbi:hypothetical protein ATK17_3028 [Branchiibius hedensis]|uniref:Amidohydrolase 3 domain-containing protein n=1 Tax=Branchiibius hedensis TaxID=672460 RepID=A0A2Y8ZTE3_9MICO|nr:amidohydrolase [Branchiibius hedensis]PWJ26850.1 hypothetical protein ATK17_3028 [Branchiibius hedensis]SSA35661.1 hypothetical protein SAMN04489750_3028 [Branchiibius hedensis]
MQLTVLRGGAIFRADAATSWATAIAFAGDRILAVGGDEEVRPYLDRADDVVDLEGRLVTPGFVDAHVHPVQGGLERARCDLSAADTAAEYYDLIGRYAATCTSAWILGGGWSMAAFERGRPDRSILDTLVPDRPLYLPNRDHHSAWVNARALELAGIDARTPDPTGGVIERDAAGQPSGLLHEKAMALVEALVPADTVDDLALGLREAQRYLHSVGITGWQDAMVQHRGEPSLHDAYLRAQDEGWLTARVAGALWWEAATTDIAAEVAHLSAIRQQAWAGANRALAKERPIRYSLPHVKVMQDGVIETETAAMIEPYHDRCGHAGSESGFSFIDPEVLKDVVTALDAADFDVHFHALGDRAVREVLDAVAEAIARNGTRDHRHHLAHLQVVDPKDLSRFRELAVAANLQALWACHEPQMDQLTIPLLGADRSAIQYPFGDLLRDGATLVMGSDWPVSSPDPWAAIHTAVNRIDLSAPEGTAPLGKDQGLPLATALTAYTAGSSWITRSTDRGTLAPGQGADLVVHDRNPFAADVRQIGATRVQRTYGAGDLLYSAE